MTDFYDSLRLSAWDFFPNIPAGSSRLANGQAIPYSLGATYWSGRAQLSQHYHARQARSEVGLMRLSRPGQTFLVYDARFNGPQSDPGGIILGAATPTIHTLGADNRTLRVAGLPAGYVLSMGDYIGWQYGSSAVRYALHRLDGDVVADADGLTPLFAVEPHIRAGVTTGTAVQLVQPVCRARIASASFGSASPLITAGSTFSWQETLQ